MCMRVHKAIPSGNHVSGPRVHISFFAMPKFGHYWYCAYAILFKVHLEAQGSGFQVGRTCVSDLCTCKLVAVLSDSIQICCLVKSL